MNHLKITNSCQKRIKQGVSFALVGTMLVTVGMHMSQKIDNPRNNGRYHELYQQNEGLKVVQGINIYVDGLPFLPMDGNGKETYPFIYQGTTYLPVRALANAFGIDINWNAKENAVELTMKPVKVVNNTPGRKFTPLRDAIVYPETGIKLYVDGKETVLTNAAGKVLEPMVINGTTYLPVRAISDLFGVGIIWNPETREDGSYSNIYIGKLYHNVSQELNDMMIKSINQADMYAPYLKEVEFLQVRVNSLRLNAIGQKLEMEEWIAEVPDATLKSYYEEFTNYLNNIVGPLADKTLNIATQFQAQSVKKNLLSYDKDVTDEGLETSMPYIVYTSKSMQSTEDDYQEVLATTTDEDLQKHHDTMEAIYQAALKLYHQLAPAKVLK